MVHTAKTPRDRKRQKQSNCLGLYLEHINVIGGGSNGVALVVLKDLEAAAVDLGLEVTADSMMHGVSQL